MAAKFGGQGLDFLRRRTFGKFDDDLVADHFGGFQHLGFAIGQDLDFLFHADEGIFARGEEAGGAELDARFFWNGLEGPVEELPVRTAGRGLGL